MSSPLLRDLTTEQIKKVLMWSASKYKNRTELRKNNKMVYVEANKIGLLDELYPDKWKGRGQMWTEKSIKKFVKDRPHLKYRYDLAKENRTVYNKASKLGILKELPLLLRNEDLKNQAKLEEKRRTKLIQNRALLPIGANNV